MTTYYIDPTSGGTNSGTLANPYTSWASVTWAANNIYLQKRGTTYYNATPIRPQSITSTLNTPLIISSYYNSDGSDDITKPLPIIDNLGGSNGVGCVFIDTCINAVVQNIAGTNSTSSSGAAVTIRRSTNVTVSNVTGYGNQSGICIYQDQVGITSGITIYNCNLYGNQAAGISMRWGTADNNLISTVNILNNIVTGNGLANTSGGTITCGGIMAWPYTQNLSANARMSIINLIGNTVSGNNGYGINITDTDGGLISKNIVTGNGASLVVDSHSIWVGSSSNFVISKNNIYSNFANSGASTGSGVGIALDYNPTNSVLGYNNLVINNIIHDQWQGSTSSAQPGCGIMMLKQVLSRVVANIVYNCRNGIGLVDSSSSYSSIFNNLILVLPASYPSGHGIIIDNSGVGHNWSNNIILNARVGAYISTAAYSSMIHAKNIFNSCTSYRTTGTFASQSADVMSGSDFIANPLISNPDSTSPIISTSSPCKYAGTFVGYLTDFRGYPFNNPPTIGPFEFTARSHR